MDYRCLVYHSLLLRVARKATMVGLVVVGVGFLIIVVSVCFVTMIGSGAVVVIACCPP